MIGIYFSKGDTMLHHHVIRHTRPNAANRAPFMSFWVHVDHEKDVSIMYAQHSEDITQPEWEPVGAIDGNFMKRLVEEFLNADLFLEAWSQMRKE